MAGWKDMGTGARAAVLGGGAAVVAAVAAWLWPGTAPPPTQAPVPVAEA
ncbi:MAG: hypothetical protein IE927_13565, partial [Rhodobacterales bacterium]|nr:hypothetical protein [Rhodobacterales bacterium]